MSPIWHALWLSLETAAWFISLAALILGASVLAAGLARRRSPTLPQDQMPIAKWRFGR